MGLTLYSQRRRQINSCLANIGVLKLSVMCMIAAGTAGRTSSLGNGLASGAAAQASTRTASMPEPSVLAGMNGETRLAT